MSLRKCFVISLLVALISLVAVTSAFAGERSPWNLTTGNGTYVGSCKSGSDLDCLGFLVSGSPVQGAQRIESGSCTLLLAGSVARLRC